ncbi:MAG: glycosyltransferase family 2 protein [Planctomycetota bacterium]
MPPSDTSPSRPPSVLVLTKNEEINIERCLDALAFSDDVVVLDSGSTDRTIGLAEGRPNVRVIHRAFDTEYKQRNYGLHDIDYKNPWLYICDADERVTDELRDELLRVTNDASLGHVAYRLRYKNYFMGRWIRRSSGWPVWIIRLVQPEKVVYEQRETNVHPMVDGTTGELDGQFAHYSFNAGLVRWFSKHNFYSDREAEEAAKVRGKGLPPFSDLTRGDPIARRRALKNLSFFLIGRPLWRFLYSYVWGRGFMDGRAGFQYCCMVSMYEYWIELKTREIRARWEDKTLELGREWMAKEYAKGGGR